MTTGQIPAGSNILIEFDPASQWYNASITIAAGWLKTGGSVNYQAYTRPPDNVQFQLGQLGVRNEQLKEDKLEIHDWYTLTLGQKREQRQSNASPASSRGGITRGPPAESLKVADLSIYFARQLMPLSQEPEFLLIEDNLSVLDRFNDEKSWVELYLTRRIPASSKRRITCLRGLVKGVHSDSLAKGPIPSGYNLLVEFDPAAEWHATATRIAARCVRTGGEVSYCANSLPPRNVCYI